MIEQVDQSSEAKVEDGKGTQTTYKPSLWERITATVCAVTVVLVVLMLVFRDKPFSDPNLVILIRMVLSLAIAIIGAVIPGFLNVSLRGKGASIRTGGALSLFLISYYFSPQVASNLLEKKMVDILDKIDPKIISKEIKKINRPNRIDLFDIEYVKLRDEDGEAANQSQAHHILASSDKYESILRKQCEMYKTYNKEKYVQKGCSEAEIQAKLKQYKLQQKQMEAVVELANEMKSTLEPSQVKRRKKLKVSYRMNYKGKEDLENITIYFGLYDENETRLDQRTHIRKWVKPNDVLSEDVKVRTDKGHEVKSVKIDGILIARRGE